MHYPIIIYFPNLQIAYELDWGTGDNLILEDEQFGYVGYINYDKYSGLLSCLTAEDSGMLMLTEPEYDALADCSDPMALVKHLIKAENLGEAAIQSVTIVQNLTLDQDEN